MKQLRNFAGDRNNRNTHTGGNTSVTPDALMDEAMRKYGNMDENALLKQLMQNIRAQRADGTYNEAQMLSFINMISPHLDETQRRKLEGIMTMISGQNE